jgi:hypothetical protein
MITTLFTAFVGNPWLIGLIGLAYLAWWYLTRSRAAVSGRPRKWGLLTPALIWLLWAVWEWVVVTVTPEANIRVDLLLIVPLALIAAVLGPILAYWRR